MTDFFDDLERELRRAHRRDTESHARSRVLDLRRLLPGLPAAGLPALVALAVVVALVAVVVTVAREPDVERSAAPPGKKVVATDVERGVRFSLDGRVLTVQLLPNRPNPIETVSGARISATCGANVAAPGVGREITLTRLWPAGQTSLSYRFPRDVSRWCQLYDQSGSIVASVSFLGACAGADGADRRDRQQVGAALRLQPSDLHRLHEPDRLRAGDVPTDRGDAHPGLQGGHAGVGSVLPRRDGPGNRH